MDIDHHILEKARAFVPLSEEEFLVTFANKGLYKRACKDLEKEPGPVFCIQEERVRVTFSDGVSVLLSDSLPQSACTCPSKSVCKHILMAVLALAALAAPEEGASREIGTQPGEEGTTAPAVCGDLPSVREYEERVSGSLEDFEQVRGYSVAALRKELGKKAFEDAVAMVFSGCGAKLSYGKMLTGVTAVGCETVHFPRQSSVSASVCGCGTKGMCIHRAVCILQAQKDAGALDETQFSKAAPSLSAEEERLLERVTAFARRILSSGLAGLPDEESVTSFQMASALSAQGFPALAKLVRSLADDLEIRGKRGLSYDYGKTAFLLARIVNHAKALRRCRKDPTRFLQLKGTRRSDYTPVPPLHLTGLGASGWQTRSGYAGVTCYLWCGEQERVFTYSVSRPTYYRDVGETPPALPDLLDMLYRDTGSWRGGVSAERVSQSSFVLSNARVNGDGRISSSGETECVLEDTYRDVSSLPICHQSFESLARALPKAQYDYFLPPPSWETVLVAVKEVVHVRFDKTAQCLNLVLCSQAGDTLETEIPFTPVNERMIQYFERNRLKDVLLCARAFQREDGLKLLPVSVRVGGHVFNPGFHTR